MKFPKKKPAGSMFSTAHWKWLINQQDQFHPSMWHSSPFDKLFWNRCLVSGCQLQFRSDELAIHVRCHIQPSHDDSPASRRRYKCPYCPHAVFASWPKCSMHHWTLHEVDTGLHACTACPYKTVSRSGLTFVCPKPIAMPGVMVSFFKPSFGRENRPFVFERVL